jgi:hypothetical protein
MAIVALLVVMLEQSQQRWSVRSQQRDLEPWLVIIQRMARQAQSYSLNVTQEIFYEKNKVDGESQQCRVLLDSWSFPSTIQGQRRWDLREIHRYRAEI